MSWGLWKRRPLLSAEKYVLMGKIFYIKKDKEFRKIRGKEIAMIFQDPMNCLDPVIRVGKQIMEMLLEHEGYGEEAGV